MIVYTNIKEVVTTLHQIHAYYSVQVKEKSLIKKREYWDGIKRRETRQTWMDGCCHGDNLSILLINRHRDYLVCWDNIGHASVD